MYWRQHGLRSIVTAAAFVLIACGCSCGKKQQVQNNNNATTGGTNTTGTVPRTNNPPGTNSGSTGGTIPPVDAEFGLDTRPSNETCLLFDRPPSQSAVKEERAFPNVTFSQPLALVQTPDTTDGRWFVMEQGGRVYQVASEQADDAELFIDIRNRVTSGGERGLLGIAFHPDWPTTHEVFLSYTSGNESRISRFTSNDGGATLDESSEQVLLTIDQPYSNHNGGGIGFGPDRYLYIGMGDGGSGGDPLGAGQDVNNLLGSFLRIDVIGTGDSYEIPPDNPFAQGGGSPEIYAWGVRNPWRWSFDMETGTLWAGDVGQNAWEEVSIIERGGNYGWNAKEGTHCFNQNPCDDGPWIDPVVEYDHSMGRASITGGFVYRGSAVPSLAGVYIFGDYVSGHIYGIFDDADGNPEMRLLFQHGGQVSTFAQGRDGEVLFANYGSGRFYRIVRDDDGAADDFPRLLSQTGCMDANDVTKPAAGLVPYGVNAEFWSDGADKARYFALPDGESITVEADGTWSFPVGTILVKNFRLNNRLVETRLFMHHDDGDWGGYSYEWNDAGTDAVYAQGGKVKEVAGQSWIFPSGGDCMQCHTQVAGRALGPETLQLNGDFTYTATNRRANQLKTLSHIGYLTNAPEPDAADALVDPFGSADLADRAASYLHANCSNCHREGTALRPQFDFTYGTNLLADAELCNTAPVGANLGNDDARRLVPGEPANSLMWTRMNRRDAHKMPPIGSSIVDAHGADLLEQWISGLGDCEL